VNINDLTPELTALVAAARDLSAELVRQVTDFAEFVGRKYAEDHLKLADEWPEDDDTVDLGGTPDRDDALETSGVIDLSGILLRGQPHSAIGIV